MNKSDYTFWSSEISRLYKTREKELCQEYKEPNFLDNVDEDIVKLFSEKHELTILLNEEENLLIQRREIENSIRDLQNKIQTKLNKITGNFNSIYSTWNLVNAAKHGISPEDVLSQTELGRRILSSRKEKEILLRTLMLISTKKDLQSFVKALYEQFNLTILDLEE